MTNKELVDLLKEYKFLENTEDKINLNEELIINFTLELLDTITIYDEYDDSIKINIDYDDDRQGWYLRV